MARANRTFKLENRTNRLKLPAGKRHWVTVGEGIALAYRRTGEGFGMWQARAWLNENYTYQSLGQADDYLDSDNLKVLDYFQAYDKARQWAAQLSQERLNPHGHAQKTLTVGNAVEGYLAWFKDHRKGYKETYTNIHAHILPTFNDLLVTELRTSDMRSWLNKLSSTPARIRTGKGQKTAFKAAPKTEAERRARKSSANRSLTILKAILNKAFQDELVTDDAAWRRVKPFENADEPITRFLTEAECSRLINAAKYDFRQLVKAALFTGARYTEMTTLKVKNVNLVTGNIYIQPSKSGKGRYIPLSSDGQDFFRTQCAGKVGEQPVFTKQDKTIWGRNHHVRELAEACKNAKIEPPIGFHELRHTYASLLAQAGADLLTISKLLGHADTRITSRHYAHLCDKTLATTVNKLLPSFGHIAENKIRAIKQ